MKNNQLKNWSDLVIVLVVVVVGILLLVISQLGVVVDTVHWKSVAPAQREVIGPPSILRVARTSAEKGGYFMCIKPGGQKASGSPNFSEQPEKPFFTIHTVHFSQIRHQSLCWLFLMVYRDLCA